jgi:hypothetical protein
MYSIQQSFSMINQTKADQKQEIDAYHYYNYTIILIERPVI